MPPRYGSFVSVPPGEMQRHIAFCARALADGGAAEISFTDRSEVMPLWMRRYRKRPDVLELQLSRGHLGRSAVAELDAEFALQDLDCARKFTPKTKLLSRILVNFPAADAFTPLAVLNSLEAIVRVLGVQPPFAYSVWHRGPFDSAYAFAADDPIHLPLSFRAGRAVGRTLGRTIRALSSPDQET